MVEVLVNLVNIEAGLMPDISPEPENQIPGEPPLSPEDSKTGQKNPSVQTPTDPAPKTPEEIRADRKTRIAKRQESKPLTAEEIERQKYTSPRYAGISGFRPRTIGKLKRRP